MSKAKETELSNLHSKLARVMLQALETQSTAEYLLTEHTDLPEPVTEFLEKAAIVNPALLTAITKFLKDNEIISDPEHSEAEQTLSQTLANKRTRRRDMPTLPEELN